MREMPTTLEQELYTAQAVRGARFYVVTSRNQQDGKGFYALSNAAAFARYLVSQDQRYHFALPYVIEVREIASGRLEHVYVAGEDTGLRTI